jgi:hypothetical protein
MKCAHFKWDTSKCTCKEYCPAVLDVFVAQEELNIHPSMGYKQMWGYDTDNDEEVVFD